MSSSSVASCPSEMRAAEFIACAPELSKTSGGSPATKRGCSSGWMSTVGLTLTSMPSCSSDIALPASIAYWSP